MDRLREIISSMGLPASAYVIHALVGGSGLHGIKLEGRDDTDIYATFIESPESALGLDELPHFVTSTSRVTERNKAGDIDVTCYSLRRWAELAAQGNPTVLHFLFAPPVDSTPEWQTILSNKDLFLSKSHSRKFIGFADAQLKRMTGVRGMGKHGQRDELNAKFGYDVKAAMHVFRLLFEGIELMREGTITFPRPEKTLLLEIRTGQWNQDRVISDSKRLFTELEREATGSNLQDTVDRAAISRLIAGIYVDSWRARALA